MKVRQVVMDIIYYNFSLIKMINNNFSDTSQERNNKIDLIKLSKEENWSEIRKARTTIAITSLKKSLLRISKEKQLEKVDNIQAEDDFNLQLSKEIMYQKVATEYGDSNSITKGIFSAKGDLYVTVGSSGEGKIWNTNDHKSSEFCSQISTIKSASKICGLALHPRIGIIPHFAPNIITGSTNGEILVWTLSREAKEQTSVKKEAHSQRVNSIKFLQSGNYFLSSSYDKNWALWDAKRFNKIFTQKGHEKQIHTSSIHPDQSLFLTGDLGGFGMVWDLRTGKGIYEIKQSDSILCSDFNPNGYEIAVAGKNNTISIFDLRRKKELKKIPAHLKLISDVKYHRKSLFLTSVSHDNSIKLWHGIDYSPLPTQDLQEQHKITSIDLINGKMAVTGIDRKWSMFVNKIANDFQ